MRLSCMEQGCMDAYGVSVQKKWPTVWMTDGHTKVKLESIDQQTSYRKELNLLAQVLVNPNCDHVV